jgi:hypothetical protein
MPACCSEPTCARHARKETAYPRCFATTISGTPAMTASEAHVWRRMWKVMARSWRARRLPSSVALGRPRPRAAVVAAEYRFGALLKKRSTLLRQHHMAGLAGLALTDRQRAGIRVEVGGLQPDQLTS